jgi:hypothetical protein
LLVNGHVVDALGTRQQRFEALLLVPARGTLGEVLAHRGRLGFGQLAQHEGSEPLFDVFMAMHN